jgi:galactoside O-acetyltransferase
MNNAPNSFFLPDELSQLGFKSIGNNVLISRFARFYGTENMEIGNHVRIDDFCILSGKIKLGSYIHISAYCALYGQYGIKMEDYTGLSPRCTLFSAIDDFSGNYLIGPMVKEEYTNITRGQITIKQYSQIGAGTVIFPKITIDEGVAVGAMSLIKKNLEKWTIYAGIPAKKKRERNKQLLNLVTLNTKE